MAEDTVNVDNNMLWIGGGILLVAGVGTGIFFYLKNKKENASSGGGSGGGNSGDSSSNSVGSGRSGGSGSSASGGFCKYGDEFPLRHGSCGKKVMLLQKILLLLGADLGKSGKHKDGVDGKFGNKTQTAMLKYGGKTTASYADLKRLKKKKR